MLRAWCASGSRQERTELGRARPAQRAVHQSVAGVRDEVKRNGESLPHHTAVGAMRTDRTLECAVPAPFVWKAKHVSRFVHGDGLDALDLMLQ